MDATSILLLPALLYFYQTVRIIAQQIHFQGMHIDTSLAKLLISVEIKYFHCSVISDGWMEGLKRGEGNSHVHAGIRGGKKLQYLWTT